MRNMKAQDTALALVDVQGKLADLMFEKESLFDNIERMIRGAQALQIPILWAEQNPDKMGPTIQRIRDLLPGQSPISKMSFSCCGEPAFMDSLTAANRPHILIAGIEAHVCVLQTATDLASQGFAVDVVTDAVSSRTSSNRQLGIQCAQARGAGLVSVEMALFEMMRTAAHPAFREILKVVR